MSQLISMFWGQSGVIWPHLAPLIWGGQISRKIRGSKTSQFDYLKLSKLLSFGASAGQGHFWGGRGRPAKRGIMWPHLVSSGLIWRHLASSGLIWRHLASFGFIWPHLASSGLIWRHLASSGVIWPHLASSGLIERFSFKGFPISSS